MKKSSYSLFQKIISSVWILSVTFIWMATFAGHLMNLRDIDGKIGLLAQPVYSQVEKTANALTGIFKPVNVSAVDTFDVGLNPKFDIEQALQRALRAALANFVSSLVQFVLGLFDKLISAIENAIQSATGLKLNLGSFRAVLAIKAQQITENLTKDIDTWMNENWPIKDTALKNQAANVINAYQTSAVINESQKNLPQGITLPNTPSAASLENSASQIASAAASVCSGEKSDYFLKITQGATLGSGCSKEKADSVKSALNQRVNDAKQNYNKLEAQVDNQAPADCKGYGIVDTSKLQATSYNFDSKITLNTETSTTITNPESFTSKATILANNIDVKTLSKEQCDAQSRVQSTLAAATADKSAPGSEADLLQSLFDALKQALLSLFDKLINAIVKVFADAATKFLSIVPGFAQNFVSGLTGAVSTYISSSLNGLRSQVAASLT